MKCERWLLISLLLGTIPGGLNAQESVSSPKPVPVAAESVGRASTGAVESQSGPTSASGSARAVADPEADDPPGSPSPAPVLQPLPPLEPLPELAPLPPAAPQVPLHLGVPTTVPPHAQPRPVPQSIPPQSFSTGSSLSANSMERTLSRGVLAEESQLNLPAAIGAYQEVVVQYDQQRSLAAQALFRLGECYRKLGHLEKASVFYSRLLREFPEQPELANRSREHLFSVNTMRGTATQRRNTVVHRDDPFGGASGFSTDNWAPEQQALKAEQEKLRAEMAFLQAQRAQMEAMALERDRSAQQMAKLEQKLAEVHRTLERVPRNSNPFAGSANVFTPEPSSPNSTVEIVASNRAPSAGENMAEPELPQFNHNFSAERVEWIRKQEQASAELHAARENLKWAGTALGEQEELSAQVRDADPLHLPQPAAGSPRYRELKNAYEEAVLEHAVEADEASESRVQKAAVALTAWVEKIYLPELEASIISKKQSLDRAAEKVANGEMRLQEVFAQQEEAAAQRARSSAVVAP